MNITLLLYITYIAYITANTIKLLCIFVYVCRVLTLLSPRLLYIEL